MSSSQNCETPPLRLPDSEQAVKLVQREFERYGLRFKYLVEQRACPEWTAVVPDMHHPVTWKETGKTMYQEYVVHAVIERAGPEKSLDALRVFTTTEGPLLGIVASMRAYDVELQHPCVVSYHQGKLQLLPIFGVGEHLQLSKQAIRAAMPPTELLLSAYPEFILQSMQGRFQILPAAPLHDKEVPAAEPDRISRDDIRYRYT